MMTKKEKKAIELLKQPPELPFIYCERENAIGIVLKLIKKQQKEIEDYKIKYVHLESDYQVLKDDLKDKRIAYVDTPEFEEKFINKDKIREKIKEVSNGVYDAKVILKDLLEE